MNARVEPFNPPRSTSERIVRVALLLGLVLAGLLVGAIAGLFVADWLGWLPRFNLC